MKTHGLFLMGIMLLAGQGCATQQKLFTVRGSEDLLHTNPIKKIAIIAEAKLMRPRMGGKTSALSLTESKLLVEDSIPKLKQAFEAKGYEVVFAEPAGVGFYWYGPGEYWVYNYDAKTGEPDKWLVTRQDAVFEYPVVLGNASLHTAVTAEFDGIYDAYSVGRLLAYEPQPKNLAAIAAVTKADTVCFARLWGDRYSAGRKAGDMALSLAAALFGVVRTNTLREERTVHILCGDAGSGKIVWQQAHAENGDPLAHVSASGSAGDVPAADAGSGAEFDQDDNFFRKAIAELPEVSHILASDCSVVDRVRSLISCDQQSGEDFVAVTADTM